MVVINGVLGDVSRVSTEVTDEVIVTAVEAGASARRTIQFLAVVFVRAAVGFMISTVYAIVREIYWTVDVWYSRWRYDLRRWWKRG